MAQSSAVKLDARETNEYEKVIGKELCSLGHFYLKVRITKVIKYG